MQISSHVILYLIPLSLSTVLILFLLSILIFFQAKTQKEPEQEGRETQRSWQRMHSPCCVDSVLLPHTRTTSSSSSSYGLYIPGSNVARSRLTAPALSFQKRETGVSETEADEMLRQTC